MARVNTLKGAAISSSAAFMLTCAVAGQSLPAFGAVTEMVVTVQKREQLLSNVPLSVSAFSGDQLKGRVYTGLEDFMGAVPNLSVSTYGGSVRPNFRGVGQPSLNPGAEAATAVHLNGVFLSRTYESGLTFADLERVELLRGPQGTLYGRNATGGSINFITKRPTEEFEASFQATYGNYDLIKTQAMVSGALSDRLFGRLVFASENRNGYSLNLFDGKHYDDASKQSARGTLVFEANEDLTFTVVADYHHENDGNYATHLLGEGVPGTTLAGVLAGGLSTPLDASGSAINPRILNIDSQPQNKRHIGGISLDISWDLSETMTLKSITAYRQSKYRFTGDFDATTSPFSSNEAAFNYVQGESASQISQELQLSSAGDQLSWIFGLYYFHEELDPAFFDFGFSPPPFLFGLLANGVTETNAYAAFGEANFKVTDRLSVTGGLRYSYEKRSIFEEWTSGGFLLGFFGPCLALPGLQCSNTASKSFDAFTPRFSVDYQLTDEIMAYATVSRGFKSGGFSVGDLEPAFEPELIWAYEAGLKMHDDEGRWSLNLSGFHYKYSDLQIVQIIDGFTSTVNAASSTVDGFELEGKIEIIDGLTISESFAYLHARFDQFMIADPAFPGLGIQNLKGNTLPNAPDFTNNVSVSYEIPVLSDDQLRFLFEWNWRDTTYFTEFNLTNASQPSASTINSAVRYTAGEEGSWFVEAWGKNLTDELLVSQNFISSATLGRPRNSSLLPPRTYGVTVGVNF